MLTTSELTSMREQAAQALSDVCDIVAETLTPDNRLGRNASESTLATNVPCRIEEIGESNSQRDYELAGSVVSRGGTVVRLPWNTTIEEKHKIKVNGRTLEV